MGDFTAWSRDLRVTADADGVASMVGAVPLRMLADRSGLTEGLSGVLVRCGFIPVHDRGRVLTDVAVMIACGGRDIVDVEALRAQSAVLGSVASDTTVLRALGEIGASRPAGIARVRAAARVHMWSQLPDGRPPESTFAGGMSQPGMVVLRIDGSLVISHSKKDRSAGTFKGSFGHHPLGCWIDNTDELASLMLRTGNAGSNTAADLTAVLADAIGQVPKPHRARLLITSDAAGASHGLIDWLTNQNHAADRTVEYSVGFDVDADVRSAIRATRADCWIPALDNATGGVRDDMDVAEITALLRDRLDRTGWPKKMRVFVRRRRLAPGETADPVPHPRLQVHRVRHQHHHPDRAAARRPPPHPRPSRGRRAHHQRHRPRPPALRSPGRSTAPGASPSPSPWTCSPGSACSAALTSAPWPTPSRKRCATGFSRSRPGSYAGNAAHPAPAPTLALVGRPRPDHRHHPRPAATTPRLTRKTTDPTTGDPGDHDHRRDSRPPAVPDTRKTSTTSDEQCRDRTVDHPVKVQGR